MEATATWPEPASRPQPLLPCPHAQCPGWVTQPSGHRCGHERWPGTPSEQPVSSTGTDPAGGPGQPRRSRRGGSRLPSRTCRVRGGQATNSEPAVGGTAGHSSTRQSYCGRRLHDFRTEYRYALHEPRAHSTRGGFLAATVSICGPAQQAGEAVWPRVETVRRRNVSVPSTTRWHADEGDDYHARVAGVVSVAELEEPWGPEEPEARIDIVTRGWGLPEQLRGTPIETGRACSPALCLAVSAVGPAHRVGAVFRPQRSRSLRRQPARQRGQLAAPCGILWRHGSRRR